MPDLTNVPPIFVPFVIGFQRNETSGIEPRTNSDFACILNKEMTRCGFTCTARVQQQSHHPHATRGENNMSRCSRKTVSPERELGVLLNVYI